MILYIFSGEIFCMFEDDFPFIGDYFENYSWRHFLFNSLVFNTRQTKIKISILTVLMFKRS
jgi:hypothetical protein